MTEVTSPEAGDALDKIISDAVEAPVEAKEPVQEVQKEAPQEVETQEAPEEVWPKKAVNALAKAKGAAAREKALRQAEREQYERELAKFRTAQQLPKEPPKPQGMPREEDFIGKPYGEYLAAVSEWQVEQKLEQTLAAREKKSSEQQREQAQKEWEAERDAGIDDDAAEAAKVFPDFADVLNKHAQDLKNIAPHVKQALREADAPAHALYALAQEGLLADLNGMSLARASAVIARMEDKAKGLVQNKPVTRAPAPMKANTGSSGGGLSLSSITSDQVSGLSKDQVMKMFK